MRKDDHLIFEAHSGLKINYDAEALGKDRYPGKVWKHIIVYKVMFLTGKGILFKAQNSKFDKDFIKTMEKQTWGYRGMFKGTVWYFNGSGENWSCYSDEDGEVEVICTDRDDLNVVEQEVAIAWEKYCQSI